MSGEPRLSQDTAMAILRALEDAGLTLASLRTEDALRVVSAALPAWNVALIKPDDPGAGVRLSGLGDVKGHA